MGVVYEAHDRHRGMLVALKTLRRVDAESIYRFKREFRALADIAHPNLVSLYELVCEAGQWLFTMELLDGTDLLTHVRGRGEADAAPGGPPSANGLAVEQPPTTRVLGPRAASRPCSDVPRLRSALRQLVSGVRALHDSGHLHRDIKPSNVRVTSTGRVVLLDFGVITARGGCADDTAGTPDYMAPEQTVAETPLTEASDWYGLGVLLYEALTGRRPFSGDPAHVIAAKQIAVPPPPRDLWQDVPADLDQLCSELLRVDPDARPTGADIARRLGTAQAPSVVTSAAGSGAMPGDVLVGRDEELAVLRGAYQETKAGAGVTLYVCGSSGVGKTALVSHFLAEVSRDAGAVVLGGRCYERESVPYKAVDSLVDSLCRHLIRLPRHEVDAVMPRDIRLLERVFPVLRRVDAVAHARRRSAVVADPPELRRRAFEALRELVARVAELGPLVLHIDDLQWGDVDSAPVIEMLMRPPAQPPLLLLGCYRAEDADQSPFLRALLRPPSEPGPRPNLRTVTLGALSRPHALALARTRLSAAGASLAAADLIARESEGNPYFIDELVRSVASGADATEDGFGLDGVIRSRVAALAPPARRVLELVTVAGRPIALGLAMQAAGLDDTRWLEVSRGLRANNLMRLSGVREHDVCEPYHDRIREAVVAGLSEPTRVARHRELGHALQAAGVDDPEALAMHFRAAGDRDAAGELTARAAHRAAAALAFDRAADLYRLALELRTPGDDGERFDLLTRLGHALANAGRGAEAATVYLEAAVGARHADALDLRRRAAEQLLRCGHIDDGLSILRTVLAEVGMDLPEGSLRPVLALVLRRAQIRLRGLGFRERDEGEIAPSELRRVDACGSVAMGLSLVDTIHAARFQSRHLLMALRAGEPRRISRALATEAGYSAICGGRSSRRTAALIERASAIARRTREPYAIGWATMAAGMAAYLGGRFRQARDLCLEADTTFRSMCTGVDWELDTAQLFSLFSLVYLGDIDRLVQRVPVRLREAEARGDLYAITNLRTRITYLSRLAAGDAPAARAEVEAGLARWTHTGFHLQHYYHLFALGEIDLYEGNGAAVLDRLARAAPVLRRSQLLRIQLVRIELEHLRARAFVAAAQADRDEGPRLLRAARRGARRIERERMPWSDPLAALIRAGCAATVDNATGARDLAYRAGAQFEAAEMRLYAAVAHRFAARLAACSAHGAASGMPGITVPDAWVRMLAPGGPRPADVGGPRSAVAQP
jgi:hypothetical protein